METIGDQVVALQRQGLPKSHIAHRLGVALSTVHYHLRKLAGPRTVGNAKPRGPRLPPGLTAQLVAQLLARGLSRSDVARRLGLAKSTVSYHAKQLGEKMDERFANRIDWSLVREYYAAGHSVRECMRTFGFCYDSWHAAVLRGLVIPRPGFKPLDEIFAENSRRSRGHLKQRLLSAGLKDGNCERCGISEWHGHPLATALHHINGDRLDNRLENLELLCPNCHSQTDTYSGRNRRRQKLAA